MGINQKISPNHKQAEKEPVECNIENVFIEKQPDQCNLENVVKYRE